MQAQGIIDPGMCPTCGQPLRGEVAQKKVDENYRAFEKKIRDEERKREVQKIKLLRESAAAEMEHKIAELRAEITKETEANIATKWTRKYSEQTSTYNRELRKLQAEHAREQKLSAKQTKILQHKVAELEQSLPPKGRPQEIGDIGEEELLELLSNAFPGDKLDRVRRAHSGSDILHTLIDGNRRAGLFVYEVKAVKSFRKSYLTDAQKAWDVHRCDQGFLVTNAFPKRGVQDLAIWDQVVVVSPLLAVETARVLREAQVTISRLQRRPTTSKAAKAALEFLESNSLKKKILDIAAGTGEQERQLAAEKRSHESAWIKREKTLNKQRDDLQFLSDMIGQVGRVDRRP